MAKYIYRQSREASYGHKLFLKEFITNAILVARQGNTYGDHVTQPVDTQGGFGRKGPLTANLYGTKTQSFKVNYKAGSGSSITIDLIISMDNGKTYTTRPGLVAATLNAGQAFEHNSDDTLEWCGIRINVGATAPSAGIDVLINGDYGRVG